jgi:AraC-like DNA-binding protein
MSSEFFYDYQFIAKTSEDMKFVRAMSDMMQGLPNPVGLECIHKGAPLSGRVRVRAHGEIGLTECHFEAPEKSDTLIKMERQRPSIARNHSFEHHISLVLGGDNTLCVDGKVHSAKAGDIFVTSTDMPFEFNSRDKGHVLCIALPEYWARIGDIRLQDTFGSVFSGQERSNINLIKYAKNLLNRPLAFSASGAAEKLSDVIALALNPRAYNAHRTGLLELLRRHIDMNFEDPSLNPDKVAGEFGISASYLYRLFASSDTTFAEYLLEQRLLQASRMLGDRLSQGNTILDIALCCGFRDVNHFGRRFRERFDCTPGGFRRASMSILQT